MAGQERQECCVFNSDDRTRGIYLSLDSSYCKIQRTRLIMFFVNVFFSRLIFTKIKQFFLLPENFFRTSVGLYKSGFMKRVLSVYTFLINTIFSVYIYLNKHNQ